LNEAETLQQLLKVVELQRSQIRNGMPMDGYSQRLFIQPPAIACLAFATADKPQDIPVPVALQNCLHHREDTFVIAQFAGFCSDSAPFHPRFQGMLAIRDFNLVAAVEYDVFLRRG
jgi:hypothetical protein